MEDMDRVYRAHAQTVYRYLLSLTRRPQLAEELTQETFCRAVYSIKSYDGSCKMSVWLCQIAKHLWYQHLAKQKPTLPLEAAEAAADEPAGARLEEREDRLDLYRAVHRLEEPAREVVLLRLGGQFSFGEIGEILGKTENWARVTFYRAKQKLMEALGTC